MKIISNFKDYYDSINYPGDDTLLFKRIETEEIIDTSNIKKLDPIILSQAYYCCIGHRGKYEMTGYCDIDIIGFCGSFYVRHPINTKFEKPDIKIEHTISKFEDYVKSIKPETSKFWFINKYERFTNIRNYFKNTFIDKNVVYFRISNYKSTRNYLNITYHFKNLKDIRFQRIFDPYTAFQEIEMFLGNYLNTNKEIVDIKDNKVLLEAKGFDNKTSFRHPIK
jgi:hypothetical protein